jgi:hypothetical protein
MSLRPSMRYVVTSVLFLCVLAGPLNAQAEILEYGDVVEGTIVDNTTSARFEFAAEAGDTISIFATADDPDELELHLILTDQENFVEVTTNDDSDGPKPAIIDTYIAYTGMYLINVWGDSGEGDFELNLELESSAADREILFEEDFSDNSGDWEVGGNDVITGSIEDGKYIVDANCESELNAWFGALGVNDAEAAPVFDSDYVAEMDVQIDEGEGAFRVGLLFGVQQPAYEAINVVYYANGGPWQYRVLDPEIRDFVEINSGETLSVDFADGAVHRLGMSVTETEVRIWVDGKQVARFIPEEPIEGTIGLAAGCGNFDSMSIVHAEFDNLVVTSAPQE